MGDVMKVTILTAQCQTGILQKSVELTRRVMEELEVETQEIALKILPSFEGNKTFEMVTILNEVQNSDGVIMISAVPMLGMHGAVQNFFDHATLYEENYFDKPLMVVTYSNWLGEKEAANAMLKCWEILGGIEGNMICLNQKSTEDLSQLEREIENFYRLMKQEKPNIGSNYRDIFQLKKQQASIEKTPVQEPTIQPVQEKPMMQEPINPIGQNATYYDNQYDRYNPEPMNQMPYERENQGANLFEIRNQIKDNNHLAGQEWVSNGFTYKKEGLSNKEQTIKNLAKKFNQEQTRPVEYKMPEDYKQSNAFQTNTSWGYTRPRVNQVRLTKQLAQLPHCFTHQYDKSLQMVLKYQLTDSKEQGFIVIQDGDCRYLENLDIIPTIELSMSDNTFKDILSKKISYQKAFMVGLLKVKGNFAMVPKLDQIFQKNKLKRKRV